MEMRQEVFQISYKRLCVCILVCIYFWRKAELFIVSIDPQLKDALFFIAPVIKYVRRALSPLIDNI